MTKQEFIDLVGEDPEDVLGSDWENLVEDYLQSKPKTQDK